MKKFNHKFSKRLLLILSFMVVVLGIFAVGMMVDAGASIHEALFLSGSGVSYALIAPLFNIDSVGDRDTSGNVIGMRVWLIHRSQLDMDAPWPYDANGDLGTIPLKPGEHMHYIEGIDGTVGDTSAGAKGDITTTVTNTFTITLGGNRKEVRDFLELYAGESFIIIYQECGSMDYYVLGNKCKCMRLNEFSRNNNSESRSAALTFQNVSFIQPAKYIGAIISQPPTILPVGASIIAFSSAREYATNPNNTAAVSITSFSGLTAADAGKVFVISGKGGSYLTSIASGSSIILKDGQTWTGNSGSQLTLKVLDVNTIVEVSRI